MSRQAEAMRRKRCQLQLILRWYSALSFVEVVSLSCYCYCRCWSQVTRERVHLQCVDSAKCATISHTSYEHWLGVAVNIWAPRCQARQNGVLPSLATGVSLFKSAHPTMRLWLTRRYWSLWVPLVDISLAYRVDRTIECNAISSWYQPLRIMPSRVLFLIHNIVWSSIFLHFDYYLHFYNLSLFSWISFKTLN